MATDIRAASVYASVGFRLDKKSWKELNRFEQRIQRLKKLLRDFPKVPRAEGPLSGLSRAEERIRRARESEARRREIERRKSGRRDTQVESKSITFMDRAAALGLSTAAISAYSNELKGLSQEFVKVHKDTAKYNMEVKKLSSRMKKEAKNVKRLDMSYTNLRRTMINLTAAYSAFAAVTQIANVGKQFEAAGVLFDTVFKEASADEMGFLRSESDRLGVSLLDSSKAYAQLAFAAKDAGATVEQIRDIYTSFSEASVVMGVSQEDTAGIFRALIQMYSKTTAQAEELRGQLGDRLVGAWTLAAKAMGMSTEEFDKAVTNRLIKANDLIPALAQGIRKHVAEGLPKALGLLERRERRLLNQFERFQDAIFKAGLGEALGFTYDSLIDVLKGLEPIAELFSRVLRPAITLLIIPLRLVFAALHDIYVLGLKLKEFTGLPIGFSALEYHPVVAAARGISGETTERMRKGETSKVLIELSEDFKEMFDAKVVKSFEDIFTAGLEAATGG